MFRENRGIYHPLSQVYRGYCSSWSSSPYNYRVPIQLGTTMLDRAMARITVELASASDTWWQTYMSTMVTTKVAGIVEMKNVDILTIGTPLVTTKPTVIPPFRCKWVKGLVGLLPAHSYWVNIIAELTQSHQITWGVMATSTYGDLCPGSRNVGMMLQNLSTHEVRIPPRTIIGSVQADPCIFTAGVGWSHLGMWHAQ